MDERVDNLAAQCSRCKGARKFTKNQCKLWYTVVSKRYPDAIEGLGLYLKEDGTCKGFVDNGKSKS